MNGATTSRRLSYYRKIAARCGVPPQFLDDAVEAIDVKVREQPGHAEHWKRMARFTAIDQMRFWRWESGYEPNELMATLEGLTPTADEGEGYDPLDEQDKRRAVAELLGVLPLREHCVIQLRLDGWPHMRIGELFGISESRAATVEKTAIKRLRKSPTGDTQR